MTVGRDRAQREGALAYRAFRRAAERLERSPTARALGRYLLAAVAALLRSLTLRAIVLLAIGAAATLAFVEIAEEVLDGEALPIDAVGVPLVRALDAPALDAVMKAVTFLGSWPVLAVIGLAIALWALRRGRRRDAAILALVVAASQLVNVLLKLLFQRARPEEFLEIVLPPSYSFPSAHAMASMATYGTAAVVLGRLFPQRRLAMLVAAVLVVLLIGASRVYLGVHWPTDVLAGFAAGGILMQAGWLAMPPSRRSADR